MNESAGMIDNVMQDLANQVLLNKYLLRAIANLRDDAKDSIVPFWVINRLNEILQEHEDEDDAN